jgi:hypothetical protein
MPLRQLGHEKRPVPHTVALGVKPSRVARNVLALDETQAQEMKTLAGQSDLALGSVHAITREGVLVIASASGSQSPHTPGVRAA